LRLAVPSGVVSDYTIGRSRSTLQVAGRRARGRNWKRGRGIRLKHSHRQDPRDAEWIADPLAHGLLRPSFVPPPEIGEPRDLTCHRVKLMHDRNRVHNRIHKVLEDASPARTAQTGQRIRLREHCAAKGISSGWSWASSPTTAPRPKAPNNRSNSPEGEACADWLPSTIDRQNLVPSARCNHRSPAHKISVAPVRANPNGWTGEHSRVTRTLYQPGPAWSRRGSRAAAPRPSRKIRNVSAAK